MARLLQQPVWRAALSAMRKQGGANAESAACSSGTGSVAAATAATAAATSTLAAATSTPTWSSGARRLLQHLARGGDCTPTSNTAPTNARPISTSTSSSTSSSSQANAPTATTTAAAEEDAHQQQQQQVEEEQRVQRLMRVLLQPISRAPRWHPQLSPHLVDANGQLLADPSAVLKTSLRALHVVRGVLREGGHVYVVENNALLRPLLREAARSCLNPNVWWMESSWKPGTITNAKSHRRLFRPEHQPNRRLFAARGLRLVNPHCPDDAAAGRAPPPRLDWADKWALHARSTRQPECGELLEELLDAEQGMLSLKPPRTLPGAARALSLLVVLDTTRNAIALSEASQRGIPTVALASGQVNMSNVTYPVMARDFSPAFVHFFLDALVKVVNVGPLAQAHAPRPPAHAATSPRAARSAGV